MRNRLWIFMISGAIAACSGEQGGQSASESTAAPVVGGTPLDLGAITLSVPPGWQSQPPSSSMRKAQFVLPRQGGDEEDAEMVVFYFGSGSAGSVEANLNRWRGQMKGAEGATTKSKANGMNVTTLDVKGAYSASMGPMMQSGPEKPGYRMIATIVESPAGAYYFKLTGPQATVEHWSGSVASFIASAKAS